MPRDDPYRGFRFRVELDFIELGGFSRVKGIARETKYESFHEGGVNDFEHKLVTMTTYGPITLERGLAHLDLWLWHEAVIEGVILRQPLSIVLHDETDAAVWRWLVMEALPVKWTGTDLDAASAQVTVESVELVHHGIKRA
jgi:phage tail-like protein